MNAIVAKLDKQKHNNILLNILLDISRDSLLSKKLLFKWWTLLYFLYGLDRFSTDLDFDLINIWNKELVLEKIWNILKKYWEVKDLRIKRYTIFGMLSYWDIDHNIKIEVSLRWVSWEYSYKNFLWIKLNTMNIEDIFSNKLVALINRSQLANRDIYDIHFLLKKQILANKAIIIQKTGENLSDYIIKLIDFLQKLPKNYNILNWLWEVLDSKKKAFCKNKLIDETIFLLHWLK